MNDAMSSSRTIPGLHHVTAICGAPQANVDFYVGTLGQRLVKRTVNFDDPGTYHLYYGDAGGTPGSILTFFPFANAGPGRTGTGMASAFAYGLGRGGLDALAERGIETGTHVERFGERVAVARDPDGLQVEFTDADTGGGFHSVTLCVRDAEPTARILSDILGYERHGSEREPHGERIRFASPAAKRGEIVDLIVPDAPEAGRQGTGTIHHVAFRAENGEVQREWQDRVRGAGLDVTPVIDRQYFDAIYFREPGGVLFEIATDPPGFANDESEATMGEALMLPSQYEAHRSEIERALPPLNVPAWSAD